MNKNEHPLHPVFALLDDDYFESFCSWCVSSLGIPLIELPTKAQGRLLILWSLMDYRVCDRCGDLVGTSYCSNCGYELLEVDKP